MDAPNACQAILLAYHIGHDRNVIDLLRGTITTADSAELEFFQVAAFKLQSAHWLAYTSHGRQRIITRAGREMAQKVHAALIQRFGERPPRELIARLAPDCLKELDAWRAECAPLAPASSAARTAAPQGVQ